MATALRNATLVNDSITSDTQIDIDGDDVTSGGIIGKAVIKEVTLIQKNNNEISLARVFSNIQFYEDIYATNISGYVEVEDFSGGLEKFYISGGEKLRIIIAKKTNGEIIINRNDLVVYRVTGGEVNDIFNTRYQLSFVSESYVKSMKKKIFKSYYNKKINDVAKNIFSEISTGSLSIDDSLDVVLDKPFVCTGLNPLSAIQKLAQRSCSVGKFFTLFERVSPISGSTAVGTKFSDTHIFTSLEKLKTVGNDSYKVVFAPKTGQLITDSTTSGTIRASQLIRLDNFNHIDNMISGLYNSRITTLNHISRNYFVKNISHVSDSLPETILPERDYYKNKIIDTNSNNPFSQYNGANEYPGEKLIAITVNDFVSKESWIDKDIIGHMINGLYRVQIVIDGSTNKLSCGDSVSLYVPSKFRQNATDKSDVMLDEMLSGYYLVTSVKHTITNGGVYTKRVELGRGTLPVNLDEKFSLNNGTTPIRKTTFVSTTPPTAFNDVKPVILPGTINTITNTYDGLPIFGSESLPPSAGSQGAASVSLQQEVARNNQTDTSETRIRDYVNLIFKGNIDKTGWWNSSKEL